MMDTWGCVLVQVRPCIRTACYAYLICECPGPIPQPVDWYLCVYIQVHVLANSHAVNGLEIDVI